MKQADRMSDPNVLNFSKRQVCIVYQNPNKQLTYFPKRDNQMTDNIFLIHNMY